MKNFLHSLLTFLPRPTADARPQPHRDWLILLASFLALLVISIGWNVWFFERTASDDFDVSSHTESNLLGSYPSAALDAVFSKRAQNEEAYKTVYPFVDPSR